MWLWSRWSAHVGCPSLGGIRCSLGILGVFWWLIVWVIVFTFVIGGGGDGFCRGDSRTRPVVWVCVCVGWDGLEGLLGVFVKGQLWVLRQEFVGLGSEFDLVIQLGEQFVGGVMPDGGMFMSEALDEVKVGLLHG